MLRAEGRLSALTLERLDLEWRLSNMPLSNSGFDTLDQR